MSVLHRDRPHGKLPEIQGSLRPTKYLPTVQYGLCSLGACRVSALLGKLGELRVDLEPHCGENVEVSSIYPMFFVSFFFREYHG